MCDSMETSVSPINLDYPDDKVKFPRKLWELVNSWNSGSIAWSPSGNSIVLDYDRLADYFRSPRSIFVTKKISSFTRQLNIYGFKKVSHLKRESHLCTDCTYGNTHEFYHDYFVRDREDLLQFITRKSSQASHSGPVKRKRSYSSTNETYDVVYQNIQLMESITKTTNLNTNSQPDQITFYDSSDTSHPLTPDDPLNCSSIEESVLDIIEMKMLYMKNVGWIHLDSTITTASKKLKG